GQFGSLVQGAAVGVFGGGGVRGVRAQADGEGGEAGGGSGVGGGGQDGAAARGHLVQHPPGGGAVPAVQPVVGVVHAEQPRAAEQGQRGGQPQGLQCVQLPYGRTRSG